MERARPDIIRRGRAVRVIIGKIIIIDILRGISAAASVACNRGRHRWRRSRARRDGIVLRVGHGLGIWRRRRIACRHGVVLSVG
jgi:hypothetical protein